MILRNRKPTLVVVSLLIASGVISVFIVIQISTNAQISENRSQIPINSETHQNPRRVVELDEPEWRNDIPLRAKIGQSKIIAIGVPIGNECRRSQDGNQITTDYEIRLQEVFKGDAQPNSVISVSMPGGLVTEPDRTLFEARARPIRRMQNGKTYVMFLTDTHPNSNSPYKIVRGSQGLYEIPQYGSRVVHLGRSFELPPADDGEEISVFLQSLRNIGKP